MKLDAGDSVLVEITGIMNATLVKIAGRQGDLADVYSVADGEDIGAQINAILAIRALKKQTAATDDPTAAKPARMKYGPVPASPVPGLEDELDSILGAKIAKRASAF